MIELLKLGEELQNFFSNENWKFCFIGGIVVARWGEPRFTRDIDVTLLTGFGYEESFIDSLLSHYESRIDDARKFALKNRVLLLKSKKGHGIDIALGALPFEENCINRRTEFAFTKDISLLTCSAEDLIVMKAFADRALDWHDVKGIIIRQGEVLDWEYVFKQLTPLCELKEHPEIVTRLEKMRNELKVD